MNWDVKLVQLAAFATASAFVLAAWCLCDRGDRRLKDRLRMLRPAGGGDEEPPTASRRGLLQRLLEAIPKFGLQVLPENQLAQTRLRMRLVHAGFSGASAVYVFVAARLLLLVAPPMVMVILGLTGVLNFKHALLYGGLAGVMGSLLPGFWLDSCKARRQKMLFRSLPDFLDLLVTCVESGLSFDSALRRVTIELRIAHRLLALEMDRLQREIEMGGTPEGALQNLAERTDMESIRVLGLFVKHARRFGTSIAEALRSHSDMLREQREQRAEELAQKAAVKVLFPTLLLIFPAVFVVLAGPAVIQLSEKFAR